MIKFFIIFSKRGQIRFSRYFDDKLYSKSKTDFQKNLIKICLLHSDHNVSFLYYRVLNIWLSRYVFVCVCADIYVYTC